MNDGGPAFPVMINHVELTGSSEVVLEHEGMSLRDYFAAEALPGLVAEAVHLNHVKWDATAEHAYHIADAMLKVRSQPPS